MRLRLAVVTIFGAAAATDPARTYGGHESGVLHHDDDEMIAAFLQHSRETGALEMFSEAWKSIIVDIPRCTSYTTQPLNHSDKWIEIAAAENNETTDQYTSSIADAALSHAGVGAAAAFLSTRRSIFRCGWDDAHTNKLSGTGRQPVLKKNLPVCDRTDTDEAIRELTLVLAELPDNAPFDGSAACHNFACRVSFPSFSPSALRESLRGLTVMYSGDSQSNLFQKLFLALLLGGEKANKCWAQQSFANPTRRGQDWHIVTRQILAQNGLPRGKSSLSTITLDSHDVRVSRSAVHVCSGDEEHEEATGHHAAPRLAPELRSMAQGNKRAPDLFYDLDSKLHSTHLGHPFAGRHPGLVPRLESDLTECLRELSVAWPNAVVLGLTVPSICSQKYDGEYRGSLNSLWSGDAEGRIRTCADSKLLLDEPLLTCAAGMSDERGARELHARGGQEDRPNTETRVALSKRLIPGRGRSDGISSNVNVGM